MNILRSLLTRHWRACTLASLAAITVLSLSPLPSLSSVPGEDKLEHLLAYAVLMLPTALRRPRRWPALALFFLLYSGLIELIQPYVNRSADWRDLAANGGGLVVGLALGRALRGPDHPPVHP